MRQNNKNAKGLRFALSALLFVLGAAIVASPAAAATRNIHSIDGAALAMVIAFGALLFAIVFEVWRMTLNKTAPIRVRPSRKWPGHE